MNFQNIVVFQSTPSAGSNKKSMSGCSQEPELINSPDPDKCSRCGHHDVYWIGLVLGLGGIAYACLDQDHLTSTVSYKQAAGMGCERPPDSIIASNACESRVGRISAELNVNTARCVFGADWIDASGLKRSLQIVEYDHPLPDKR